MAGILNKKATKELILKRAKVLRSQWDCKRVSAKAISQLETFIRMELDKSIHRHPTVGKTFMNFD